MIWPIGKMPHVLRAGRFALMDRGFTTTYRSQAHYALHIYDYACAFRMFGHGDHVQHSISPGDMTLLPPGVASAYHLAKPGHHVCVHFSGDQADTNLQADQAITLPCHATIGPQHEYARQRIMHIAELKLLSSRKSASSAAAAGADATLQELLLWLAIQTQQQDEQPPVNRDVDLAMRRVAALLDARLDQPLSVPELAMEVGLSQGHLARCFKQRYGLTLQRYLLTRRIEQARQDLATTHLPVKQVAARAGLPDPQHFNKQFRRITGQSPTSYRHLHQTPRQGSQP